MTRTKRTVVGIAKSSAGVGAWAGGIYGLLMGSSCPWFPGTGATLVSSPLAAVLLGSLEGAASGAALGALVGALMGWAIYDVLKHEHPGQMR